MLIYSAEISRHLGFIRQADEPETNPKPAPAPQTGTVPGAPPALPVGDPGVNPLQQPPPIQSSTGPEAVSTSQVEQLRQVLTEMVGEEAEDDVFEPSFTPARKQPQAPQATPSKSREKAVFRSKKTKDDQWLPLAKSVPQDPGLPFAKTQKMKPSKMDPKTELVFSKDPREEE